MHVKISFLTATAFSSKIGLLKLGVKINVKVVDSCWISSTEWSDTFRSFFVYGKKQESRKKIYHNHAKKFHLPEEV